jgi:hypothetical protein
MRSLSFSKIHTSRRGQTLDDFALFVVEFGPGFQPSFFASRTGVALVHSAPPVLMSETINTRKRF